jgi:hypothetical protein
MKAIKKLFTKVNRMLNGYRLTENIIKYCVGVNSLEEKYSKTIKLATSGDSIGAGRCFPVQGLITTFFSKNNFQNHITIPYHNSIIEMRESIIDLGNKLLQLGVNERDIWDNIWRLELDLSKKGIIVT